MPPPVTTIHTLPPPETPPPPHLSTLPDKILAASILFHNLRTESPFAIHKTPLIPSTLPSSSSTLQTFLKLESEQFTNSFKLRGALNHIYSTNSVSPDSHFVTASTGNHALAVVYALKSTSSTGTIFLPDSAKQNKVAALQRAIGEKPITLTTVSGDCLEAELAALKHAKDSNCIYVSPYNDELIIAGQGTIGVEVLESLTNVRRGDGKWCCYVTVGGGGLISGIAAYLKDAEPEKWRIVGCVPANSAVMYRSVKAGFAVKGGCEETLSDGSAGEIEEDALTIGLCAHLVDAWAVVREEDIESGIRETFECEGKVVEGAAAVAVAGWRTDEKWRRENACGGAVVVICGGNIDGGTLVRVLG